MVFKIYVIIWSPKSHVIVAWTYTTKSSRTLKFCCRIQKVNIRLFHEVFEFLDLLLEVVILAETLSHFKLLLEWCSIVHLRLFSRQNASGSWRLCWACHIYLWLIITRQSRKWWIYIKLVSRVMNSSCSKIIVIRPINVEILLLHLCMMFFVSLMLLN